MATPYIVSKFPISKEPKHFETFPNIYSKASLPHCNRKCGDSNNLDCDVCERYKINESKCQKSLENGGKESLCHLFKDCGLPGSAHNKLEFRKVKCENRREPPRSIFSSTSENQKIVKIDSYSSGIKRVNPVKGKDWTRDNTYEVFQYKREVELVQNGIKYLSTGKKPMLPADSPTIKSTKPVINYPRRMPPQTVHSQENEKVGKQKEVLSAESKRNRYGSDSSDHAFVEISAAPKRLREKSPLILSEKEMEIASSKGVTSKLMLRPNPVTKALELNDKYPTKSTAENSTVLMPSNDDCIYAAGDIAQNNHEEEVTKKEQNNASSSPSYSVGDTLEKITLEDKPAQFKTALPSCGVIDSSVHPSLRLSLFSHVPPFVRFWSFETKAETPLPKSLQKLLKWKLSTITPIVVRQTVVNSGFKLVRRSTDWGGMWGRHMKSICFKTLRDNQKINHIPGTYQIGRKDRLWKNLHRFMLKFGKKEFGFIPRTYVLPHDCKALKSAFERAGSKTKWIIKPPASARGSGIKVIHKWTQIPRKIPLIVQKYILNPYLINGNKFDLRLYVLVTSFNPLRVYIYDNGLVRFASVKYSEEINSLTNRYMHLTNYSINKLSTNYTQNVDAEACEGHKWTIRSLWQFLEQTVDTTHLWKTLIELVIKTIISAESSISQLTKTHLNSRYSAYELFGVDVLLDSCLKPWLLEVNISPSLHSSSPLDTAVKGPLVTDLLNMAGFHIPNIIPNDQAGTIAKKLGLPSNLCFDHRMYITGLSNKERAKHSTFCKIVERVDYLDSIIEDLTPDDVRHLIVYEDEMTQLGNFQKIFPTSETHNYFQYLEGSRYYNMLFDAWETKFHYRRKDGIRLLESKCKLQIHLDISDVEHSHSVLCAPDTPTSYDSCSSSSSDSPVTEPIKVQRNDSVEEKEEKKENNLDAVS